MNKNLYKIPLKLTGDRLLFIIITWVFSVTLTVVLDFITGGNSFAIGIYYSIVTAIPYLMLIYYEAFDAGHLERVKESASMKNAFLYCLIWQSPSLIFFALYLLSFAGLLSTPITSWLVGGIWLAPFMGPRWNTLENANLIQYIIFIALEWGFFLVSYYMGMKDIVLIKPKKKKSSGTMKK
ncbi:MAG: hypothetical protein IJD97_00550 [Clostridia bacterium]|nr:hypothetical protein [Clostridia bacterium]